MNAADLLAAARRILDHPAVTTAGVWPRAVALLTRQALEKALDEFWAAKPTTAGLSQCPRRSQFACLPFFLNASAVQEIAYVWGALSDACHYHAYELAPTAAELTGWIDAVAQFMAAPRDRTRISPVAADPVAGASHSANDPSAGLSR